MYHGTFDHLELTKSGKRSAKRECPGPRTCVACLAVYSSVWSNAGLRADLSKKIVPKLLLPASAVSRPHNFFNTLAGVGPLYIGIYLRFFQEKTVSRLKSQAIENLFLNK